MSGNEIGFYDQDIQFHEDDRAQRLLNVFNLDVGQVNVSYVSSKDHVVAWHRHEKQTDIWVCLQGAFKVGLVEFPIVTNKPKVHWIYLSEKRQKSLVIPPNWYHGYRALEPNSILMYYMDQKYDPNDEFRQPVGTFNEDWGTPNR
jgi:dTDP-4-dehydrorhamnose 3,5-epimerase-like enzyme